MIQQPYGNALLMGVGGSGRKSLSTLAASISEYKLKSIEISKSYGRTEWGEDLKKIFKSAGEAGEPTVFLFDDTQIVYESFLEDINLILNTGEVPNLYANDELMAVYDTIGKEANAAGINTGNMSEMYKYFVSRCRTNLHVVLCMSPIGDAFRRRLHVPRARQLLHDRLVHRVARAGAALGRRALPQDDGDGRDNEGGHRRHLRRHAGAREQDEREYVAEMGRHFYVRRPRTCS